MLIYHHIKLVVFFCLIKSKSINIKKIIILLKIHYFQIFLTDILSMYLEDETSKREMNMIQLIIELNYCFSKIIHNILSIIFRIWHLEFLMSHYEWKCHHLISTCVVLVRFSLFKRKAIFYHKNNNYSSTIYEYYIPWMLQQNDDKNQMQPHNHATYKGYHRYF